MKINYLGVQDKFQIQMRTKEGVTNKENAVRLVDVFADVIVNIGSPNASILFNTLYLISLKLINFLLFSSQTRYFRHPRDDQNVSGFSI